MKRNAKLYVVVDEALPSSAKTPQAVHAAIEFSLSCKSVYDWHATSNTIAILQASADTLRELLFVAQSMNVELAEFHEIDLDNRLTSIALAPCEVSDRICRKLKMVT